MVKILLSHKYMSQDDLKSRGDLHVFKMDGIAAYLKFQPLINEFKPLLAIYSESLLIAKLGGDDRIKAKNRAKKNVDNFITEISREVEGEANKNRPESEGIEFAENAGFDVQKKDKSSKKIDYLATPVLSIEKEKGRSGVMNFGWVKIVGAITYALFEVDKDGNMHNISHTNALSFQLTGLEIGVPKTYCMKAIGTGTLASEMSAPVTVWIN